MEDNIQVDIKHYVTSLQNKNKQLLNEVISKDAIILQLSAKLGELEKANKTE